ncbi:MULTISPECIES: heme exporter protein CcmD [Pseudomonas]|uniref:Heme exporter protein D n=1 Tax=Pseudomonas quercus TaxID=2722792 RepID=A0ABX0YFL6_9PSED|nr:MULTISPECIES: heme exporter protein CcmD [Pseudomonas]MBF7142456.1 heme exporter protein CcmD [Pseudomonas sp. LY10J]NJP00994.1 heme exporter protein CcmD [Pseudomonas quercus]
MSFSTWGDFLAMGHHGLYVWSAYGCCALVLLWNLMVPLRARRRLLDEEARRVRRSKAR